MEFIIGDRVIYEGNEGDSENIHGEIVAVGYNARDMIPNYLMVLNEGILVQFTLNNHNWIKVGESIPVS